MTREHRLAIATIATSVPMGAQVYQEAVASRAAAALASVSNDDWVVTRVIARSLRSDLSGNRRLPIGAMHRAGPRGRRALGRVLYPSCDLVHRMDLTLPPAPREVLTLHDTVAWQFPDEGTPSPAVLEEIRRAVRVVCVSANTARDVTELTGRSDLNVVHPGVDARFFDPRRLSTDEREYLGLRGRYVLHAGGASLRKNLEGLAGAWKQISALEPDVTLALAGPPHPRRDRLFAELPRVRLLGRLDDGLVPGLLASAAAVVVPSLYEGFGLPVVEAMAAGSPVVVARTSSLPEVAGNAGVLVDPDSESIAAGLSKVLDSGFDREAQIARGRKRASGFTWDASVEKLARVWSAAIKG